jgi:hypothetical protein
MEPERKIEKLLRAYAKKRRDQAGDPLKLHPATRRLLQSEAARSAPRPDQEAASLTLWELFWQKWAFLLGFALTVFFCASLFLPALSVSKRKAQAVMTKNNLLEIGTAARMFAQDNQQRLPASLDELTNELQLDLANTILIDPQNGRRFVYVGGGKRLDELQSNSILAYSPADKEGRTVLFADGRVEVINHEQFSVLTNGGLSQLVAANDLSRSQIAGTSAAGKDEITIAGAALPVARELNAEDKKRASKNDGLEMAATNAPELAANQAASTAIDQSVPTHGLADIQTADHANSVQFTSAGSQNSTFGMQNSFKNTAAPAQTALVLANFQVQQNGSTIRVVDSDGSVYDGSLRTENSVTQNAPAPAAPPQPANGAVGQVEQKKIPAGQNKAQAAQNYFFRVVGTNRTLKQAVVFDGNLLLNASASVKSQQSPNGNGSFGGGLVQPVPTNQLPWSSSRIAGTAVVSDTNNIEINAVPQSP